MLESYDTVVTGCASCTLMLKDYIKVFDQEPEYDAAIRLRRRVKHISEVVAESGRLPHNERQGQGSGRKVTYHSSCHLRASGVTQAPRQIISAARDCNLSKCKAPIGAQAVPAHSS